MEVSSKSGLAIASSAACLARLSPEDSPVPIIAFPIFRITARTSAKSRLMSPSFTIRSVTDATPEKRTWSAMANASENVVWSLAILNRFWFGITIRVSTQDCRVLIPSLAVVIRRAPSKLNGLVTTPTVRIPRSRAACATIGAAPVPVPPPIPAVMKTMCEPVKWFLMSSIASSAAARPISGCEPAPRPSVATTPIWIVRLTWEEESA